MYIWKYGSLVTPIAAATALMVSSAALTCRQSNQNHHRSDKQYIVYGYVRVVRSISLP